MPKLKTKSGAKKRFSFTANGHVTCQAAFKRHNLRKRSQKMKRQNRGTIVLPSCEVPNILKYMPYNR